MSLALLAAARHQAETLGNLVRGLELIASAYPEADLESRYHLGALGRWILARSPLARARAAELGLPASWLPAQESGHPAEPAPAPPGLVRTLLLDADRSGEAFCASLLAEEGAAATSGWLAETCSRAEACLFRLLGRQGRLPRQATYRLRWSEPASADELRLEGRSAEAAAALALFSLWSRRPLPGGLLVSAALGESGELLPVEGLAAKLETARREEPQLTTLVIAEGSALSPGPHLRTLASLEELLALAFGADALQAAPAALDLEGTLRFGLELYEKQGRFEAALEVLGAVLERIEARRRDQGDPPGYRVEEFLARWRLGCCLVHLGDPRGAGEELRRASQLGEQLWDAGELNPQAYLGARGSLAVLLRDLHQLEAAETLLRATLELQRSLRQDQRELARTLGNLGELLTQLGRFDEAEAALLEALAGLRAVYPEEVPRELCYLGNLALRRGQPEAALALFEEGLEANRQVVHGRAANQGFLRYGLVRALLALGRPEAAIEQAGRALAELPARQLHPRQLVLKQSGLAELALGRDSAESTLRAAASPALARGALARFAVATALGELALHHLGASHASQRALAWPLLGELVRQSRELLDELWQTGRAARLEALLAATAPADLAACQQLAAELRATLDLLPY